jgi:serine/threonine protein kinase
MTAPSKGALSCSRCGSEVASGVHFCAICGNDVSGVQASLATEQMPTPTGLVRGGVEQMQKELLEQLRHATLGEYEVLGELGRGGMATVYLAHEIALDRKVAIKVMSPQLVSGDGMIERFKREARTAASLSHPNIIPVYAVRESEHLLFFVMKFVQGRPLDSIIKEVGPLPIPMVKAILAQAGSAFGYAHRRGIVHRDIKPANIMIDDEGWAVVTDFGIAKVSETQGLTMTGMTVGTPTYMSPEQCMAQDVTGASDQYSLGVVGYEMITGKPPFGGGSMMTIMYGHFNEAPPPIPPLRPDCPPDLQTAIMRMLAKAADQRWPSVDDAVAAVGAQSLSHDDPTRHQLVSLAREGAAKTQALIGKMSVPLSPIPGTRSRPGVPTPAATTAAARTAVAQPATRSPRPQPAVPSSGTGKGLLIGGGIGLAVVLAGLLVLKPWQKPTPVEPPVSAAPAPTELAGTGTPPATNPTPVNPPAQTTAAPAAEAPVHGTPEEAGSRIHPQPSNASSPPPTNIRVAAPSAAQLAKDRAAYEQMRRNVDLARQQAVTLGASVTDLSGGDISVANATTNASRDRYDEAMTQLGEASTIYVTAASSARQRAAAAAQQQAAVPVPVPAAPAAEAVADDRGAIELVLSQYFRAVSAGKLDRMKELFPTMPTDVQATYRDLFKSGSSIDTSNWEVISTDLKGAKAVVQINGQTTLRDKKGKILAQSPAPKSINLEKVSGAWRIGDVHQ